jgi:hypothetical protein
MAVKTRVGEDLITLCTTGLRTICFPLFPVAKNTNLTKTNCLLLVVKARLRAGTNCPNWDLYNTPFPHLDALMGTFRRCEDVAKTLLRRCLDAAKTLLTRCLDAAKTLLTRCLDVA